MKINPLYFLGGGLLVLVVLFFILKPKTAPQDILNATPLPTLPINLDATASARPMGNIFELIIKDKKIVSGPEIIKVTADDEVVIKITIDEAEEFHLHGYDKSVDLEKDIPVELKFRANLTGRFPFELEQSKIEIGALEVLPK
jgi:hypothetical protein